VSTKINQMKKIYGNHSIVAAANNKLRKKAIYHGSKKNYLSLGLNCAFQEFSEDFLEVNEYFIESNFKNLYLENRILLLDGLMDPRNIGAIIRCAAAFNFAIILREHKGCPINTTVVQCASGGIEYIKIAKINNINSNLQLLKRQGFWCVGLHENGTCDITKYNKQEKMILVIGSEHDGLSPIVKKELDAILYIKTTEFSTLNASVAASLAMFTLQ
jgi:23S rRNA (guanosine2251-2'-O)-methyltransferase